jgi:50S ribosomal protein L16 3-hydroxylase
MRNFHTRIVADRHQRKKDMDVTQPLQLLGGLSPERFMRAHWQKKPLLVRQAISNFKPFLARGDLFQLTASQDVYSRLVIQDSKLTSGWRLRQGPFERRALPALKQPGWTLLVQGADLQSDAVHELMNQFRFVPDARMDDLMISYATDQGGVGPHFDSYDVFLLQAHGSRRWRIGRQKDLSLQPDVPLKILANFEPEQEFVLEPGDMIYLPPRYAHDGIALGECMTYSIGFRSPHANELAGELLQRLAQEADFRRGDILYRDPTQPAQAQPAKIPASLLTFADQAVSKLLTDKAVFAKCLGEHLSEPKPNVWFEAAASDRVASDFRGMACTLDRRTRMMYDDQHVFINGESCRITGRDARLMRLLADQRRLESTDILRLSPQAMSQVLDWLNAGWISLNNP